MTTYPEGYLVAMWIAFEDIHPGSGPLVYYPGSHRLPVIHATDVGISPADFNEWGYREFDVKYTPTIDRLIESEQLEPSHFHANRGDVLFWHANLLHGGSARTDFNVTRKALVFHFFADGCVCYHDLRGQLAWANGKRLTGGTPERHSSTRRR
jgi:ectoine hydroxylase-related dioxygenase (phytanoyl-CoA dioxygenase family)